MLFRVNEVRFNDEVCDFTFVRQQVAQVKEKGADIVKGKLNGEDATYIIDLKMLPVYMLNEQIKDEKFNCRMLKFSHVVADTGEDGTYKYGLTDLEREQLPHVNEVVLQQILLPENHDGLLAEE